MSLVDGKQSGWEALPLADNGRSVIEASAGTGKTYTIGMLYLRLVLEEDKLPREILVTTFTRAAAAEISARVRAVLEAALEHQQGRPSSHDGVKSWLDVRWKDRSKHDGDGLKLAQALAGFDQAAIGTLHSICQRILSEHPFSVRAGFIAPTLVASKDLHTEIARDLWRTIISPQDATGLRQAYLDSGVALTFEAFKKQFDRMFKDGLHLDIPSAEEMDFARVPSGWNVARLEALAAADPLHGGKAASKQIAFIVSAFIAKQGDMPAFEISKDLSAAATGQYEYKKHSVPADEIAAFENFIRPLAKVLEARRRFPRMKFWSQILSTAGHIRDREMASAHSLTFDAVLTRVRDALINESAPDSNARPLADALFAGWPAAMVDEFQDTDGIQFDILDRIYSDAESKPRGRLVMIGDPKQSIYRFRGADVNVFTRATRQAPPQDRLTLGKNFRSSKPYVEAINYVYAQTNADLGGSGQDIYYQRVEASDRCDSKPFTLGGHNATPLTIWLADADKELDPLRACAGQIASLLTNSDAKIGDQPVVPGDIAVLLTSNSDVYSMVNALRVLGVPAVSKSTRSVFKSTIAYELQVLLHAIVHASDPAIRRAAAATGIWGESFEAIRQSAKEEGQDREMADTLATWHAAWKRNGPLHLLARIIAHAAPRYLKTQSGERALTDLRHLGELIQANTLDGESLESQLAWLVRQIEDSDASTDEESAESKDMRMESDQKRVQVMTMHVSKGLEFPIVFLPTAYKGPKSDGAPYVYTDAEGVRRITLFEDAKDQCNRERDEERRRILYVALTRAIHACHVFALQTTKTKGAEVSVGFGSSPIGELLARGHEVLGSADARKNGVLLEHRWPSEEGRTHYNAGPAEDAPRVARRVPPRPADALPDRHSFSSLTGKSKVARALESAPADDEHDSPGDDGESTAVNTVIATTEGIKGPEFGNALHAVMEHRDFSMTIEDQPALVAQQLRANGVVMPEGKEAAVAMAAARMLDRSLHAKLKLKQNQAFSLSMLKPEDSLAEMEFHFEVSAFKMKALLSTLSAHGLREILPDRDFEVRGLLNGKIDLVFASDGRFHVLDYKSNSLGNTDADYSGDSLIHHMDHSFYRFQALIYVVALDRYLATRIPDYDRDQHLGEAVYLFVRAARSDSDAGVWSYRFDSDLIESVQGVFSGADDTVSVSND